MLGFFGFFWKTEGKSSLSMRHLWFILDFLENGRQANVFAHGLGAGVQVVCDLLNMLVCVLLFGNTEGKSLLSMQELTFCF